MAASAVQGAQLKDYLRCSICFKVFTDPRALPCLHTFCFECISQWSLLKRSGNKASCPECRKEFDIPGDGIGGLQKNFFIRNLLCTKEVKQKPADNCEICADEEKHMAVEMFCMQCEQKYCKSCSNAHLRMKNSSSHTMVSYTTYSDETRSGVDINKKYRSTFCDVHKDKQIELYCFEDKKVICMMCYFNDHSSHKCKEIKNIVNDFRIELEQDVKCVTTAKRRLDENLKQLNSRKQSMLSHMQNIETKICKKAAEMMHLIEIHKKKLISELHGITAKHEGEIDRLTETLNTAKASLISFVSYGDELLRKGSAVDISREAACLRQRAQELLSRKGSEDILKHFDAADVTFKPSSVTFEDTKTIFGYLTTVFRQKKVIRSRGFQLIPDVAEKATTTLNTDVTTTATESVQARNHLASKVETSIIAHTPMDPRGSVMALAFMGDEMFASHLDDNHVSVYDTKRFLVKRNIVFAPQFSPSLYYGLAACPFNKLLFASDCNNDCVHRVDLSNYEITLWRTARYPRGLSLTSKHTILVACYGSPLHEIQEYTPTGILLTEISHDNDIWQAIETINGTLLVCRCGPIHGIAELTWDGRVLRCYGNKAGSGQDQLNNPRSLAVTSKGIILVADHGNNRIQVLDPSLTTVRTLPLPEDITLNRPIALCYDESRGRLFVGEYNGQYGVIELEHVTNLGAMFE